MKKKSPSHKAYEKNLQIPTQCTSAKKTISLFMNRNIIYKTIITQSTNSTAREMSYASISENYRNPPHRYHRSLKQKEQRKKSFSLK